VRGWHRSCLTEVSKTYTVSSGKPRGNPVNDRSHLPSPSPNQGRCHGPHSHSHHRSPRQRGTHAVNSIAAPVVGLDGSEGRATLTSQLQQTGGPYLHVGSAGLPPPPRYLVMMIPGSFLAARGRQPDVQMLQTATHTIRSAGSPWIADVVEKWFCRHFESVCRSVDDGDLRAALLACRTKSTG
jgi:hypothetical protein